MKKIIAILAVDQNFGIGKNGDIPWKSDLKNFKEITTATLNPDKKNALIMGRKTFESIPLKFRPFSNRINIVVSRKNLSNDGISLFSSIDDAVEFAKNNTQIENIFIIGGAMIYNYFFENNLLDEIYLTKIPGEFNCDTFVKINFDNYELTTESFIENNYLLHKFTKKGA